MADARGGTVVLQPRRAYRCASGLVLDASFVSLTGHALLDFSGWEGTYLRVIASNVHAAGRIANNYGHKGSISGNVRLVGRGPKSRSVGVLFSSDAVATAAQLTVEKLAVSQCGTAIRFGDRAYNNLLLHCELFECGVCVDWTEAEDNGERNTLIGCVLFNSDTAIRLSHASAAIQLFGCSLDYTRLLYDVVGGAVFSTSCHHESGAWTDAPVRCGGQDGLVRIDGGVIANQADPLITQHFVEVGAGASVRMDRVFVNNLRLRAADPGRATNWARGEGDFEASGTHSFDLSALPHRLHTERTRLSDPDFRSAVWEDPLWRVRDTVTPIVSRHGGDDDNLILSKRAVAGEPALAAAKRLGTNSPAEFVLLAAPVDPAQQVLSGFRACRDPARPGSDGTLSIAPAWLRIDGQDSNGIPVVVREERMGPLPFIPPVGRYQALAPLVSRQQRSAPGWATHFAMIVNLVKADKASFGFNGLWFDTI